MPSFNSNVTQPTYGSRKIAEESLYRALLIAGQEPQVDPFRRPAVEQIPLDLGEAACPREPQAVRTRAMTVATG